MTRLLIAVIGFLLVSCSFLVAQEESDTHAAITKSAFLSVTTDKEGARLYVDGDSVGVTPLACEVTPGRRRLKLVAPDVENWLSEPLDDSVDVQAGQTRTLAYTFSQKFLVLTLPTGAEVFTGDSLLGKTPLLLNAPLFPLTLRKHGYEDTAVDRGQAQRGILSIRLQKVWLHENGETTPAETDGNGSSVKLYITGATTVLAGAAAAYFKVRADNVYADYLRSGSPAQLADVNQLDTAAGIALAATQISLGLFTYFMLSE